MNAPDSIFMPDRSKFIGGSDAAAILGVSKWKTPFQLYQEKIGALVEESNPDRDRVLSRGKRLEPIVVEMLVDELQADGHDVQIIARNERYQDAEHPFLACELDLEMRIDGEELNGEIKTVHPFAAKDWGDEGTDEIPIYYAAQVMHGLMIVPRRRTIVAALIGADDLRVHFVERDDETIAAMRSSEIEFWQRVQDRNPPDPTAPEDVKWLYQRDGGEVIDADDDLVQLVQELKDEKAAAKNLEGRIELLATRIKARMGTAATLIYRGAPIATWKTQSANRFDTKAFSAAHPDLDKQFRKTSESRVFLLK